MIVPHCEQIDEVDDLLTLQGLRIIWERNGSAVATLSAVLLANVLAPLISIEEWTLERLHSIGLGWGLAIVGLTVLVRVSTVPLVVRQFRSQRELREHMPEMKRLQKRHKDDRERLQQEMQAYYREHGINPLSAFAPVLVQIPVFISLYYLMREDVKSGLFGDAGFLFIPHLTDKPHGAVLVALILAYLTSQISGQPDRHPRDAGRPAGPDAGPAAAVRGIVARFPAGPGGVLDHHQPLDARAADRDVAPRPGARGRPRPTRRRRRARPGNPPRGSARSTAAGADRVTMGAWDCSRSCSDVTRAPDLPRAHLLQRGRDRADREGERRRPATRAKAWFGEMLIFLDLCARSDEMLSPPPDVDAAWHAFLLHSRDYEAYCNERYGRVIHHQPTGKPDPAAYQRAYERRNEYAGTTSPDPMLWAAAA